MVEKNARGCDKSRDKEEWWASRLTKTLKKPVAHGASTRYNPSLTRSAAERKIEGLVIDMDSSQKLPK